MKQRYWFFLTQKKYTLFYLAEHLNESIRIERYMNIGLAVISTGSLAGLFAWPAAQFFLTIILALAQIVTAARPYLPYEKRVSELEKGISALNVVYAQIEEQWDTISGDELSDAEINELYYKYEHMWNEIDSKLLKADMLPVKQAIKDKAEEAKNNYFSVMFGGQNGTEGNTRK